MTDVPQRYEFAERIRKLTGAGGDGQQDPEKQQLQQAVQQLQEQLQQLQQSPQLAKLAAEAEKIQSDAALSRARAIEIIENMADKEFAEPLPDGDERYEQEFRQQVFSRA
jgi:ribosome-binding ATPase YchF (GTP1/OBG family)